MFQFLNKNNQEQSCNAEPLKNESISIYKSKNLHMISVEFLFAFYQVYKGSGCEDFVDQTKNN